MKCFPFALLLLAATLALPTGCATVNHDLPIVISAVDTGVLWISTIETFVDGIFAVTPNPALQAKVDAAFVDTKTAGAAVDALGRAGVDIESQQFVAAVAEFDKAYDEVLALTKALGVHVGAPGSRMAATPGGLTVPAAKDLRLVARK